MFLPYASDRPPSRPPVTVAVIVLINFAVFGAIVAGLQFKGSETVALYVNLSLVPTAFHWYSPITYSFLHAGVMHLSANMLFLWVFGGSVEDALGWKRFLGLYFSAAIITGLLQVVMERAINGGSIGQIVGASGAISALMGVFAVRFYRSRIRVIGLPLSIPAIALLALAMGTEMAEVAWELAHREAALNAAAHWSHIGGFIVGIVAAQILSLGKAGKNEYLSADAALEMEHGSPLTAVRRWERVLHVKPGNPAALAELGRAWALVGDKEQSLAAYQQAISIYLNSGGKSEAADRYLDAVERWNEVFLDPPELLALSRAFEEKHRYEQALDPLRALSNEHPGTREAETAALRIGLILLRKLGRPEGAATHLREFLNSYPNSDWRAYVIELLRSVENRVEKFEVDIPPPDRDTSMD
jgi:membrane associated rhomboid family serine protease